jgi:alanine transaminase
LSGLLYPKLLETDALSKDAKERVKNLIKMQQSPIGAYSHSKGCPEIREKVAEFIRERDGN